MKIFTATSNRETYTAKYIVHAETPEEATRKIKEISGENLKVKEK